MVRVDPLACLLAAVLMLTLPLQWVAAAILAAAIHELCHLGAGYLAGAKVYAFAIGPTGAKLDMAFPGRPGELLCALAGPAGSLVLIGLCHVFPRLALCGLCQGLFNLLPVYPLDGGRILRLLGEMLRERMDKRLAK